MRWPRRPRTPPLRSASRCGTARRSWTATRAFPRVMLHAGGRRLPGRRIRVNRDNKVHPDAPRQEITGRIRVTGRLWCAIGPLIIPGARILPANSPGRAADGADGNSVTRAGVAVRVSDAGAEAITTAVRV